MGKKSRSLFCLLSLILLLSFLAAPVSAHPGRTDANGGHYDRSTGQYHYHHGYSAHQHYDMNGDGVPDCPYNFKDLTGSSSSQKSTSPSSSKTTTSSAPKSTSKTTQSSVSKPTQAAAVSTPKNPVGPQSSGSDGSVFGWTLAGIFILLYLVTHKARKSDEEVYRKTLSEKEEIANSLSAKLERQSQQMDSLEQKIQENATSYVKLYSTSKSIQDEKEWLQQRLGLVSEITKKLESDNKKLESDNKKLESDNKKLRSDLEEEKAKTQQIWKEKAALQARLDRIRASAAPSEGESIEDRNTALAAQILEQQELNREQAKRVQQLADELDKHIRSEKTGIFYADDGLPIFYKSVSKKYGDYTVYLNEKSKIYHLDPQCAPKGATISHLHRLPPNYWPCSKCASGSKGTGLYYRSN